MKHLNVVLVLFISVIIFSCNKSQDEMAKPQSEIKPDKNLPSFNESNSTSLSWDQLPTELKNATRIEEAKDNATTREAAGTAAVYRGTLGPWGGNGGYAFAIVPPYGGTIYAIAIRSGTLIDRFTVWYRRSDGTIYMGGDRGGPGGNYYLNYFSTDEFIYFVGGRSASFLNHLTMYTNKKTLSYGGTGGNPFSASVTGGNQVLGFFGGSGQYVDRLGFYVYSR